MKERDLWVRMCSRFIRVFGISLLITLMGACSHAPLGSACLGDYIEGREDFFMDVAYGDQKFVVADGNGNLYTSDDGRTWSRGATLGGAILGLSHAKDQFMAAPRCGGILVSKNAKRWHAVNPTEPGLFGRWQHDGQYFLMGRGGSGIVLRSKDARDWEVAETGFHKSLLGLTKGNDLWVAVGHYGSIFTSSDWVTWTQQVESDLREETLREVIYVDGRFLAIGEKGVIITSTDGRKWERAESGIDSDLLDVSHHDGTIVIVGVDGVLLTSTDGVKWEQTWRVTDQVWTPVDDMDLFVLWGVAFGNGRFVVAGSNRTILVSEDGFNWQEIKVASP